MSLTMKNKATAPIIIVFLSALFLISASSINANKVDDGDGHRVRPDLVKRGQRKSLVDTEYGKISAVDISDGVRGPYRLQFFTLEPNSLFLPVLLHAHMVFYVQTGSGKLSWTDDDEIRKVDIKTGDLYRLNPGSVFYVHSNMESQGKKLRFYAIFVNADEDLYEPSIGAYSRISDMVTGFDGKVLKTAFKVPEEVAEEIAIATDPPAIVRAPPAEETTRWDWESQLLRAFLGGRVPIYDINGKKKKKNKPFNILDAKPDIENCNGWSVSVDKKDLHSLKGSNIGVFMVNLTKGSMMGPHWNPKATEVSVVLQGRGMIRIACSSIMKDAGCRSMRFRVKQGDVFAVPKFHPRAQISFNNESFVFMGFTTTMKKNNYQYIAGKRSVLQVLDKSVLAASFNVTNSTIDHILASQEKSIILDCTSCAEEEEMKMGEEIEKERQKQEEEAKRRRDEEAKRKEEKEARKKEEKAKKKEEKKRKEEEKRRTEEERKRREEKEEERERQPESEEEAARRQEEERVERERQQDEAARAKEREEEAGGGSEPEPEPKPARMEKQQKVNKGAERLKFLNFAKFMV